MSLAEVETRMREQAMQFAGLNGVVKFDFGGDGTLTLDARTTPPTVGTTGPEPETTLNLSLADFIKMGEGNLSPTMAFMMGKLKISGNMALAMKLSSMLDD